MSKRFTETEKWKDKWFRALRPEWKLAWLYLLDNCDLAGVIEIDEDLANFQVGASIDWNAFLSMCDTRIAKTKRGKIFIVRFIEFQYGKLSEACKPHLPVFIKLRDHDINVDEVQQKEMFKHGNITPKRRDEVFVRDGFTCCYCGAKFDRELLQPDHLIPKSRGGSDSKDNLISACVTCNAQKSDKELRYFIESLPEPAKVWERLRQRLPERVFRSLEEKEKEKEKDKDKDKDKEGVQGEETGWVIPKNLDTPEIRGLLDQFARMRSSIRKPIRSYTNTSVVLKQFKSVDHLRYALEFCIANEYQGLKPDYAPKETKLDEDPYADYEVIQ